VARCTHHLIFRTPLRAVAGTLAHLFGPTSAGWTAKGGVSTSTTCSVAVIEVYQPKLLSRDLNFPPITYRSHGPSAFWSTPFMCGCYFPRYVHAACVRPMWCAVISIWDEHVRQAKSWLATERLSGDSRRQGKRSTALQLAITIACYSLGAYIKPYAPPNTHTRPLYPLQSNSQMCISVIETKRSPRHGLVPPA
jgi:hypothetical protein